MKTLYVSDLDGTLLDSTPKTSEYTNKTINTLLEQGVCFTYATARSLTTAKKVTKGMNMLYPAVVHNGTFIVNTDGKILVKNTFVKKEADAILSTLLHNDLSPIVYSLINEKEQFSYIKDRLNKETTEFLNSRADDPRNRAVKEEKSLFDGEIYYFTLIGDENKTYPLYEIFKDKYRCYFQRDMYSGKYWLEIMPKPATKANAVKQLAEILKCEHIVAFGDGINDVEMFMISDECYAVENAVDTLKKTATKIISSNIEDGVAKWLFMRYNEL